MQTERCETDRDTETHTEIDIKRHGTESEKKDTQTHSETSTQRDNSRLNLSPAPSC